MIKRIETERLVLQRPKPVDVESWLEFLKTNRDHLAPWEPIAADFNLQECGNRIKLWVKECFDGTSARFFIFAKASSQIIGMCNFTQIFHGAFQACYLGYKIDQAWEGKGYMFEALEAGIRYVFEELHLHRIMANYMPKNIRSAKLLQALNFEIEGYAKKYLCINGQWEDHVLAALTKERWQTFMSAERAAGPTFGNLTFRIAAVSDLLAIVHLYYDDSLGQTRESFSGDFIAKSYVEAFAKISADPSSELIVAEFEGQIIGVLQVSYLRHLTFQGGLVAHIEGVRIHRAYQRRGFGRELLQHVIDKAKRLNCHRVQLMTDKRRSAMHGFYEKLGFVATHEGMKLLV